MCYSSPVAPFNLTIWTYVSVSQGGVLYVRPRKAHHLPHKPWYKGGFLKSTATIKVKVCEHSKKSSTAQGSEPLFDDTLEFILGEYRASRSPSLCSHMLSECHRGNRQWLNACQGNPRGLASDICTAIFFVSFNHHLLHPAGSAAAYRL